MNRSNFSLRRLWWISIALALLCAVLRSLAFATAYDRSVGYFDGNLFSTLYYIGIAAAVCTVLYYVLHARRMEKATAAPSLSSLPDMAERSVSIRIICAPVLVCYIVLIIGEIPAILDGGMFSFAFLRALIALCAIPYFLCLPQKNTSLSGLCTVLYGIAALITEYFDQYVAMNSPIKLMHQFCYLAVLLYFLTELYALSGHPKPQRAILFGMLTAVLCLANGISSVVAAALGGILPSAYLVRTLWLCALGIYAAARLFGADRPQAPNKSSNDQQGV